MSPLFWGFAGWFFIHAIALGYPNDPTDTDKEMFTLFFTIIPTVLPCPICGKHFKDNMDKNPIRLTNKRELFAWTVEMHNFVNESKGRRKLTVEEAFEEFKKNGEAFKNNSIIRNGVTLDSIGIQDEQVQKIVNDAIEKGVIENINSKSVKFSKNEKIYKMIIIGLVGYIVYTQFIKKK